MSPITKEFTKEQLQQIIETDHVQCGEASSLARIALASLEAEESGRNPVLAYADSYRDMAKQGVESIPVWSVITDLERNIAPLYSAPPAPVAVPECFKRLLHHAYGMTMGHDWNKGTMAGHHRAKLCQAVDECRAAMLQGADGTLTNEGTMQLSGNSEQIEPVSNRDELPLDYLQGHKDGLEWAAQLAEANHPQTGDWLYDDQIELARAIRKGPDMPTVQGGNSPVIPDGWVMVPVELTPDMRAAWDSAPYTDDDDNDMQAAYRAMIAAAPQWKVK
ncbi:hypothetical protein DDM31_004598 [Escherichia coli]|uniref:hypothetical protein n=1 Tax=Escherichia coli TaxID=562 RepID=UPI000BEA0337|nr:hypothetical protein [Escherichia coli]EEZ4426982.1 hypothetical protein [Escherichia coli]HBB5808013.1 hypothetical protein [Escherichia coli]